VAEIQPVDSTRSASERELLVTFLDAQRAVILRKAAGVSDEDLRRTLTPTGLSLLGLIKHLAYVEQGWFQEGFLGEEHDHPWTKEDPDADFRIEPSETTDAILAFYQAKVERSRQIVAAHSLDEIARKGRHQTSLRWIVLHMIEETARHAGHADLMRETIDGSTGD
jgi:uncharacterized damage-inducible protein DinB